MTEDANEVVALAAELESGNDLADVQRTRARLLALAVQDGGSLEDALDHAARAEMWLRGAPASVALKPQIARLPAQAPAPEAATDANEISLAELLRLVSDVTGEPTSWLKSARKMQPLATARQVFCWLAKQYTSKSFPQIGSFLGRDHTTVLHACGRVEKGLVEREARFLTWTVWAVRRLGVSMPPAYAGLDAGVPPEPVRETARAAPALPGAARKVAAAPAPLEPDAGRMRIAMRSGGGGRRVSLLPASEPAAPTPAPSAQPARRPQPPAPKPAAPRPTPDASTRKAPPKLTEVEAAVLRALLRTGDDPRKLAARLGKRPQDVTRVMNGLRQKGFVGQRDAVTVPLLLPNGRPVPMLRREEKDAQVAAALAEGRVTHCPPAYVAAVAGAEPLSAVPVAEDPDASVPRARVEAQRRTRAKSGNSRLQPLEGEE